FVNCPTGSKTTVVPSGDTSLTVNSLASKVTPTEAAAATTAVAGSTLGVVASSCSSGPGVTPLATRTSSPPLVNAATVSPWKTGSPFHRCSILNQESLPFGFVYSALFLSLATCCGFIPNTSGFSLMKLLTTLSRDSEEGGVRNLRSLPLASTT